MKVLVVEDEAKIAEGIKKYLEKQNYIVITANNIASAKDILEIEPFDVIILDRRLPDGDGVKLCKNLREIENKTPIIMLTAKTQLEDKIEGLDSGADDYLTKPFSLKELLARIKALIRRQSGQSESPYISIDNLIIDTNQCTVKRDEQEIKLSPKEYSLLEFLARNPCKVFNRAELINHVWGNDERMFSNTVDVHIRNLRVKIDENQTNSLIKTIKMRGYMLCNE
jgi:DNA-binding response OmpR family regulator